jgi:hypothetical protein
LKEFSQGRSLSNDQDLMIWKDALYARRRLGFCL